MSTTRQTSGIALAGVRVDRLVLSPRRRTLALVITPGAEVVVRAPLGVTRERLAAFVGDHRAWIDAQVAAARSRPPPAPKTYRPGEDFLYLGRAYPLCFVSGAGAPVRLNGALCLDRRWRARAGTVIVAWYRERARAETVARCGRLAPLAGCRPARVRITGARGRWGSCGAGGLNFTWRLVMAPPEVIDYVVAHELCHLAHPDHSRAFWAAVGRLMPGYPDRRAWLRANGSLLRTDFPPGGPAGDRPDPARPTEKSRRP